MITYSVAAFLLSYLSAVQAQATICLATYGGVPTRYISSASELKHSSFEFTSSWLYTFQRADSPSRYLEVMLMSCETVYVRQDEI